MNIQIKPDMTVQQIADILKQNKGRDVESYIRIETIRGKPVAFLVREPRIPLSQLPSLMRAQAE
jgi:hypothetical protein